MKIYIDKIAEPSLHDLIAVSRENLKKIIRFCGQSHGVTLIKTINRLLSFLTIMLLISTGQSLASPSTTTFQVTANIANACSVSATNLSFGSYVSSANSDVNSTITVTCTNGTTYKIGLDKGLNGASTTARQMKGVTPTNLLNYSLYSDNARSVNWGLPPTDSVAGTGTGGVQNYTVYGRIPSGQNTAAVDTYSDTIGVAVTFP